MKNLVLKMFALTAALLVSVSTAHAANYTFTFASYNASGVKIDTGLLDFTTLNNGKIKTVTGNINGAAITGLSPYAAADNKFIIPTTTTPYFATLGGISFATTGATYNIAHFTTNGLNMSIADSITDPAGYGTFNRGLNFTLVSNSGFNFSTITYPDFNVASVPEPETYAMMLLGLGLVGFSARRRKAA
ncbi:MAG TPA: PEPxxWA-CTERM sorting domain-containing protein [Methylotenera sp.]|nr:PEPxxWA-CTERM sorting domain-containing protein [Methylotenera sp.]HPH05015.1 PEPxxWA-CTERM sorting domain-containing protein [Methylotenera sp.]HPN00277.1 PEPxxWA-CTERM sorting domain-containing protein [Methylotenera sp.]